jgi:hypothetical protein
MPQEKQQSFQYLKRIWQASISNPVPNFNSTRFKASWYCKKLPKIAFETAFSEHRVAIHKRINALIVKQCRQRAAIEPPICACRLKGRGMFGLHPFLGGAPGLEQQQVSVPTLSWEFQELREVKYFVVHWVERLFDCSMMTHADTEVTEQTKSLEIMRKFAEQYAKRSDTMWLSALFVRWHMWDWKVPHRPFKVPITAFHPCLQIGYLFLRWQVCDGRCDQGEGDNEEAWFCNETASYLVIT